MEDNIQVTSGTGRKRGSGRSTTKAIEFESKQFQTDIRHTTASRLLNKKFNSCFQCFGLDIATADSLAHTVQQMSERTARSGVVGSIDGSRGLFDLKDAAFKDPILVSNTDRVESKLKVAEMSGIHNTIGIDLVARCVNDILAHGAEPLFFLHYFACDELVAPKITEVLEGIVKGCELAACALIGGKISELPELYCGPNLYDLAGFTVGAVERNCNLPKVETITSGDVVIGIPSSGLHSNGFSFVRKLVARLGLEYNQPAPFKNNRTLGEELLTPTKIYIKSLLPVMKSELVKGAAQITSDGLLNNIPRVLSSSLGAQLDANLWEIPPVFGWIATASGVSEMEMLETFNCGLGFILIVAKENCKEVIRKINFGGEKAWAVGSIVEHKQEDGESQVLIRNFSPCLRKSFSESVPPLSSWSSIKNRLIPEVSSSDADIVVGEIFVHPVQPVAKRTVRSGVLGSVGSCGGLFDLRDAGFKDPILVTGVDGVGTKLKVVEMTGIHNTIGIDLSAMCANGVLAHGAKVLFGLDYFACDELDVTETAKVVERVAKGCELCESAPIEKKTAEVPGMYGPKAPNLYDMTGFAIGAVERKYILPRVEAFRSGDVVIGISSSGLHTSGFSLVCDIVDRLNLEYTQPAPFQRNRTLGEELATPAKSYAKVLLPLMKSELVKGAASIADGGLLNNIPRGLPSSLGVQLDATLWEIPPVFGWIFAASGVFESEMLRTFNCGLGFILIVAKENSKEVIQKINSGGEKAWAVGSIVKLKDGEPQVLISNFSQCLWKSFS